MYVRVCVCVGQTLLSYARGFPRGPKTYRRANAWQGTDSLVFPANKDLLVGGLGPVVGRNPPALELDEIPTTRRRPLNTSRQRRCRHRRDEERRQVDL